jgi:hypothetical protein
MLRNALSVIAGLVAAVAIMMACEYTNAQLHPFPEGLNTQDIEAVRSFAATMPLQALLLVALGWTAGSFVGGFVATRASGGHTAGPALVLAVLLTAAGGLNAWMIQNPAWFHAGGLPLFVLFTMLGEYAGRRPASL